MAERVTIPVDGLGRVDAVPGLLDGPGDTSRLLVLAHGAGAPMDGEFMTLLAAGLVDAGVGVLRFDFPYMVRARAEEKRRPPDRAAVLEAVLDRVVGWAVATVSPGRLAVGGKSMGGRIATHLLAGGVDAREPLANASIPDAGVLYGYPLHRPGRPDDLRDGHLPGVGVPLLFLQGERDALARIDLLEQVTAGLPCADLVRVADADHDFKVPKRTGRSRDEIVERLAAESAVWLRRLQ